MKLKCAVVQDQKGSRQVGCDNEPGATEPPHIIQFWNRMQLNEQITTPTQVTTAMSKAFHSSQRPRHQQTVAPLPEFR